MIGGSNLSCLIGLSHLTSTLSDEMILADVSARQLSKAPEGRAWSSPSPNSKPTKKSKGPPFHLVLVGNAGKTKKPYEIPRILRYLLFSEFTKCQKAFRHRHSTSDIRCPHTPGISQPGYCGKTADLPKGLLSGPGSRYPFRRRHERGLTCSVQMLKWLTPSPYGTLEGPCKAEQPIGMVQVKKELLVEHQKPIVEIEKDEKEH